jgi:hypothetical protein
MSHMTDPHPRRPAAHADRLREACGVFGVYAPGSLPVARLT